MMIDRRRFLGVAATGVAISLTGVTRVGHRPVSDIDLRALAHPELLVTLGAEAVREIGDAYRRLVPSESDRTSLEAALRAERRGARWSNEDSIRADFDAGRVIVVHDWMLSRTEARQCALYSLPSA